MEDREEKEQSFENKERFENKEGFENEDAQDELSQDIMEEIEIEDLTVDGICGVY